MMAGATVDMSALMPVSGIWKRTARMHGRHGRWLLSNGLLLRLDGEGRVGGMSKAHQTEAARIGCVFLDGRGLGPVIVVVAGGWARHVAGGWTVAIFRHSEAVWCYILDRLVLVLVLVAALEEASWIEGTTTSQISFATARSESPQRHCARRYRQVIYADTGRTTGYMAQSGVEEEWRVSVGTMGPKCPVRLRDKDQGHFRWGVGTSPGRGW
jgi:hypothetical protein